MKFLLGYCVLCIFLIAKVQSKPQITKLFPVKELAEFHERTNEIKPFDKFLSKLRATYNFVFNRAEDTSNVEKILSTNAPANPEIEALKLILANVISPKIVSNSDSDTAAMKDSETEGRAFETGNGKYNSVSSNDNDKSSSGNDGSDTPIKVKKEDDWLDGIEPPTKDPEQLEMHEDSEDDKHGEITTTPSSTLQLPVALGKHLLEWLGALLGLTYGAYARVAQAVKT